MVLIMDTYIGCQDHASCTWTVKDEGHAGLFTRIAKLFSHR
jgi:hypothetical protein